MTREVTMPQLGFTMIEGTVTGWRKREGEAIAKGEPLLEVTTEKVSIDVESPVSGVVQQILVSMGSTVPVGTPVCLVAVEATEPLADSVNLQPSPSTVVDTAPYSDSSSPGAIAPNPAPSAVGGVAFNLAGPTEQRPGPRVRASGLAKRVARENGVDLALLRGSGPGGRVLEADVLAYLAERSGTTLTPTLSQREREVGVARGPVPRRPLGNNGTAGTTGDGRDARAPQHSVLSPQSSVLHRLPYAGNRRMIGERMFQSSQSTAQVTLAAEVDATEALRLRSQLQPEWEKDSIRLTLTDLIVKACGKALREHQAMNASLDGEEILLHDAVNVGIAVALPDGLIVPVIRDADSKPLRSIAAESSELVERARGRRLTVDDVTGGTFTITNLGGYGIDLFTPIINPGETAILGVGRAVERPAVYNGDICKRSLMYLCLTFDHRLVDGAPAAEFMQRLRELIERPYLVLA